MVSVREYMSTSVVALEPDATVADAIALIKETGHQGFPVVTDEKIIGVVTSTDLVLAKHREKIATVMTTSPFTANPDDDVVSVAGVMAYNHIHHLPVVDDERVVGMVTATDLLRASIENIISENIERILTFFQTLHPDVKIGHTRVAVTPLIPTQKLLDPEELRLREQQFDRGVIYPIVVAKRGRRHYIIDGHHRAYLAYKRGMKEIPAFFVEGELGITKASEKLSLKSLDNMTVTVDD